MFETLELTKMAQGLAAHAGQRMAVIARNVAHADTPRYRAADIASFAESYAMQPGQWRYSRPGHLDAKIAAGFDHGRPLPGQAPNGNSVSLETEMVKAAAARQDHDMALSIYRATSGVIRAALGRK